MGGLLPGGAGALEIAEGGAAARIEQRLDGGVGMLGRVVDLRDVVHGCDAVVELAEPGEQLVDVHVLWPENGSESEKNVFVVGRGSGRRTRLVVNQNPIGEETPQYRLELVVMRIDEPGHDNAAGRVDIRGAAHVQVRPDGEDFLALDEDVSLGEISDFRVQRHHRTAANDIASTRSAAVGG